MKLLLTDLKGNCYKCTEHRQVDTINTEIRYCIKNNVFFGKKNSINRCVYSNTEAGTDE